MRKKKTTLRSLGDAIDTIKIQLDCLKRAKDSHSVTINDLHRYLEDLQSMFKRLADFEERLKKLEQDYDTEANKNLKPGDKVLCQANGFSDFRVPGVIVMGPKVGRLSGQYLVEHPGGWQLHYDYMIKKAKD